jgi:hypothetical protein
MAAAKNSPKGLCGLRGVSILHQVPALSCAYLATATAWDEAASAEANVPIGR